MGIGTIRINLDVIIKFVIVLLSVFVIYHAIVKLLGGSLGVEEFVLSFLTILGTFTLGCFKISVNNSTRLARVEGKFDQFERSFRALAADFKLMSSEFRAQSSEFKGLSSEFRAFREEFRSHKHKGNRVIL